MKQGKDIPRYTQIVNDYQEQTIQASREIADNYLESQKEIINSLQAGMGSILRECRRGCFGITGYLQEE